MEKLVSVIVPVYNTKDLLPRCVRSIISQTYRNLEIFLIDDGSTDGSAQICDKFTVIDNRITVIHQENSGQGVARNSALDVMKGEYIYFVDSDDYIKENAIEFMIATIEEYQSDLCICGVINDHVFAKKECPRQNEIKVYDRKQLFVSYITEPYIRGILCNKLYKSELFQDIRFSNIRAREDAEILYKIYGRTNKAVYIPNPLYVQYIRPGSTEQGDFSEAKLYTITIFEQMANYIQDNVPELAENIHLIIAKSCADVLNAIAQDSKREQWMTVYEKVEKKLKEELRECKSYQEAFGTLYQRLDFVANNKESVLKEGKKVCTKNRVLVFAKKIAYPFYRARISANLKEDSFANQ